MRILIPRVAMPMGAWLGLPSVGSSGSAADTKAPPRFVRPPIATSADGGIRMNIEVDRPVDVAVEILGVPAARSPGRRHPVRPIGPMR